MAARLQSWFARQSLTVKLLVTVPLLLIALLWSTLPGADTRTPDPSNRPVLSAATTPGTTSADRPLLPHEEPQPASTGLTWSTALRTIVSVAVVIVLILLSGQGLKYVMAGAAQPLRPNQTIRVLETLHLPSPTGRGRAAVHLVEIGDQMLLLGATDTQLTLLAELPDDESARLRRAPADNANPAAGVGARHASPLQGEPSLQEGTFADALSAAEGTEPAAAPRTNGHTRSTPPPPAPGAAGEAELAQLLQRLRESKQRLEAGN